MAIWDFSDYNYYALIKLRDKNKEIYELGQDVDEDMLREMEAEISAREDREYTDVLIFTSINNDTYQSTDFCVPLRDIPEDVVEFVKNTYDGVWEPVLDTIALFELKEVAVPEVTELRKNSRQKK